MSLYRLRQSPPENKSYFCLQKKQTSPSPFAERAEVHDSPISRAAVKPKAIAKKLYSPITCAKLRRQRPSGYHNEQLRDERGRERKVNFSLSTNFQSLSGWAIICSWAGRRNVLTCWQAGALTREQDRRLSRNRNDGLHKPRPGQQESDAWCSLNVLAVTPSDACVGLRAKLAPHTVVRVRVLWNVTN